MDLDLDPATLDFQAEVRSWLAANVPAAMPRWTRLRAPRLIALGRESFSTRGYPRRRDRRISVRATLPSWNPLALTHR
ncbi:hypothetical protein DMH04_28380 [Kibdelosporangium aridum]|uniref:Uncharacterized protein n=1 Tax=Kibdelosporangium aridum TaxID=2030 RepID=A0A428Z4F6_KIBAR|nr:hypothetical protein DMH04_28380 [Kibdelosporangium aridum]